MTNSNSLTDKQEQRFRSLTLLTILIIYLLILAGGIVRSTGSGMGCPDWPTCFGRWVPPTNLSQLPSNYQEIYGAKLKGEVEFNAVKTWIEYVNRLLGVLSGFFVFGVLLTSLPYLRRNQSVFWGSLVAFLLVGVNGWLGSRVVATELAQYVITLHFLLAILVVFALLFVWVKSNASRWHVEKSSLQARSLQWLLVGIMALTLIQIVLGTQVRDALDTIVKQLGYEQRSDWVGHLDIRFYIHRSFSLLVLIAQLSVIYQLRKFSKTGLVSKLTKTLIAVVLAEIGTGILMAYFGVPAAAQPVHLVLAVLMIGLQFVTWLIVSPGLTALVLSDQDTQLVKV